MTDSPGKHARELSEGEQAQRKQDMDSYLEFARHHGMNADDRRTAHAFDNHCRAMGKEIEPGYSGSWHQPDHQMSAVEQWRRA